MSLIVTLALGPLVSVVIERESRLGLDLANSPYSETFSRLILLSHLEKGHLLHTGLCSPAL